MHIQTCPICKTHVQKSERYSNYVCEDCKKRAVNSEGLPVKFFNKDFGGGFIAIAIKDNIEHKSEDHICFVDGIECYADEARFGGIVIVPVKNKQIQE